MSKVSTYLFEAYGKSHTVALPLKKHFDAIAELGAAFSIANTNFLFDLEDYTPGTDGMWTLTGFRTYTWIED